MERLSIICCWLNEHGSKHSVESLKNVHTRNIDVEIILVDSSINGNLDKLFEGLEVKLLHFKKPPTSIYNAFNFGVSKCNGSWFMFLHQGDKLEGSLDKKRFFGFLKPENRNNHLFCLNYEIEVTKGNFVLRKNSNFIPMLGRMPLHVGVICSKNLWIEVCGFDEDFKISSDFDFLLKCYYNGAVVRFFDEALGRMLAGGASREKKQLALYEDFKILMKYFGVLSVPIVIMKKIRFLYWYVFARCYLLFKL